MNHRGTVDHSTFAGIVPKSLEILFQPVLEITLINLARKSVLITTSLSRSVHRVANRLPMMHDRRTWRARART